MKKPIKLVYLAFAIGLALVWTGCGDRRKASDDAELRTLGAELKAQVERGELTEGEAEEPDKR